MCMIDGADYDSRGFCRSKTRRARKEHFCDECSRTIIPGEHYEETSNMYEGRIDRYHVCAHCTAARSWLEVTCGGWLWQGVLEDLKEHWDNEWELKSLWLGKAIVGMKNGWRSNITGDLMKVPRPWTAMDLPFNSRQSYDKRTTAYSGAFKTDDGKTHFTDHEYIYEWDHRINAS